MTQDDYDRKYMKDNSYENIPFGTYSVIIVVRSVFKEGNKYYGQGV